MPSSVDQLFPAVRTAGGECDAAPDGGGRGGDDVETNDSIVEQQLVGRAVAGDRTAMERLWTCHRRWVAVVLLAHKPSSVELEDLLQDVAMTMMTRIGDVRKPAALRPWLRMVAVNAARAAARAARIRMTQPLPDEPTPGTGRRRRPGVDADLSEVADEASRLLDEVAGLPDIYREALLLRCLQELSTRQIATLLDVPETTVETRVSRARRMLRELRAHERTKT